MFTCVCDTRVQLHLSLCVCACHWKSTESGSPAECVFDVGFLQNSAPWLQSGHQLGWLDLLGSVHYKQTEVRCNKLWFSVCSTLQQRPLICILTQLFHQQPPLWLCYISLSTLRLSVLPLGKQNKIKLCVQCCAPDWLPERASSAYFGFDLAVN